MINSGYINDAMVNGFYALDEEAYQLWLRDNDAPCGHLLRFGYHGDSAAYPDWVAYRAKISDFPRAGYREVIAGMPSFIRQITGSFTGAVAGSVGDLVLNNIDGTLDNWPNLAWDGQLMDVLQGNPAWDDDRFRILFVCVIEGVVSADRETITVRLRSVEYASNLPLQTNMIAAGPNAGQPIPLAFGKVFNATPPLIDTANLIYQWNDGAVTEVTDVRDSGLPFQGSAVAVATVNAGTDTLTASAAHGFAANNRACFTLREMPSSQAWMAPVHNGAIWCTLVPGTAIAATSVDGVTWTQSTIALGAKSWTALIVSGTYFIACVSGDSVVYRSGDGMTWAASATMGASMSVRALCSYANYVYAVGASSVGARSTDYGATWGLAMTLPGSVTWTAVACAPPALGAMEIVAIASGTNSTAVSTDFGAAWAAGSAMPQTAAWGPLIFTSAFTYVSVVTGTTTSAYRSWMAAPWTQGLLPSSVAWGSLAQLYLGGVCTIVAAPTSGTTTSAASSTDGGATWTARTFPANTTWSGVGASNSTFYLVANGTYASVSTNGSTWSSVTGSLPAPLAFATDYWIASAGLTSTNFRLNSTRGGTLIDITGATIDASVLNYKWTADLTDGTITFDSAASGLVTMDGTAGSTSAATIVPTVLDSVNVDVSAQTRFASTCAQTNGIYISTRRNRLEVANDFMAGLLAWFGSDRYGMFQMGRIEASYTDYDLAIMEDDMVPDSFVLDSVIAPAKQHKIGYRRNWTNQTDGLAALVSIDNRALYSADWSITVPVLGADEGPDGEEFHKLAVLPDMFPSMMAYSYDADAEAARRNTLFYGWGFIYRFELRKLGSEVDIGRPIKVTHSRYNFSGGVVLPAVHVEHKPSERKTLVKVLRVASAYTPGQL